MSEIITLISAMRNEDDLDDNKDQESKRSKVDPLHARRKKDANKGCRKSSESDLENGTVSAFL